MMESDREILENLMIDDLQGQHREIAEAVGIEGMIRLSEICGGNPIYIPKMKKLTKNKVYQQISDEYDGGNIKELAVKYGVCKSTVYNILKDKISRKDVKKKNRQIDGQMDFADIGIL